VLPAGDTVLNRTRTVQAGDPDPLLNIVTLSCDLPDEFTNDLADVSDSHSVDLIEPAFSVTKTGDAFSKVGDTANYTITLSNTSSANTPDLTCTATDSLLGVIFGPAVLPAGDTVLNRTYMVQAGDPDPLVNTVTLSCDLPDEFTNDLADVSDGHSVDLVHPGFTVAKSCTNEPVPQEGPATWDVVIANTGDVELIITADDGIGTFTLAAGTSQTFPVSQPGDFSDQATVSNTVTASWVLPAEFGLSNSDSATASDTCVVAGRGGIIKFTQGVPYEAGPPWTFVVQDCGTDGCQFDDATIATVTSPPSSVDFGLDLIPVEFSADQTYRVCEVLIPAAWTNTWEGDADDDGNPETFIPFVPSVNDDPVIDPPGWSNVFDPQYSPPPAQWTNDERCVNFSVNAGATEVFKINNEYPGGEPRTIGYWKNWNSCTGGNQVLTAIENGGDTSAERMANGFALLDDALQTPGITIGTLTLTADANVFDCDVGTEAAVLILDKRTIDTEKKMASDGAYGLAAQLLAAIANDTVGAGVCQEAGQAMIDGQNLLQAISFDGTGSYLKGKKTIAGYSGSDANTLADILDSYNNGTLCVSP
jgi:uncharacterized repeat protein (TIGR01451 family)